MEKGFNLRSPHIVGDDAHIVLFCFYVLRTVREACPYIIKIYVAKKGTAYAVPYNIKTFYFLYSKVSALKPFE